MLPTEPQTTVIPDSLALTEHGPFYRWLAANGITEWIPDNSTIIVDSTAGKITYRSFAWHDDQRGYNAGYLDVEGTMSQRTVMLVRPLDDQVRAAADGSTTRCSVGRITFVEQ